MRVKADEHFPICIGACGRRGDKVVWYQITDSVRFGECLRCYDDRQSRASRIEGVTGPPFEDPRWDPPAEGPTGPSS